MLYKSFLNVGRHGKLSVRYNEIGMVLISKHDKGSIYTERKLVYQCLRGHVAMPGGIFSYHNLVREGSY